MFIVPVHFIALAKPLISLQVLKQVTYNQRKSCHQLVLS